MSAAKTRNWKVRPGYAFTAGAGLGAGLFVFEFLNVDEDRIHAMGFAGIGMAGGPGGGTWKIAQGLINKLATTAGLKALGAVYGVAKHTTPGYKKQVWSTLPCNKPFSSGDLHQSTGRVTILGLSAAAVGLYACYISASDGIVSATPLFESVSVDVRPQQFDLQVGAILGAWWEAFDIPAFEGAEPQPA